MNAADRAGAITVTDWAIVSGSVMTPRRSRFSSTVAGPGLATGMLS
ncbi:MAG: hypothetical protein ACRD0O_14110 [Acidimicrobiia bacterium]